jgi:hypothetical protein
MVRFKECGHTVAYWTAAFLLICLLFLAISCFQRPTTGAEEGRWINYEAPPTSHEVIPARTLDELKVAMKLQGTDDLSPALAKQLLERGYPFRAKQVWGPNTVTLLERHGYSFLPESCGVSVAAELSLKLPSTCASVIVWSIIEKDRVAWIYMVDAKSVVDYKFNEYCVTTLWPGQWILSYDASRGLATFDVKTFTLRLEGCGQLK